MSIRWLMAMLKVAKVVFQWVIVEMVPIYCLQFGRLNHQKDWKKKNTKRHGKQYKVFPSVNTQLTSSRLYLNVLRPWRNRRSDFSNWWQIRIHSQKYQFQDKNNQQSKNELNSKKNNKKPNYSCLNSIKLLFFHSYFQRVCVCAQVRKRMATKLGIIKSNPILLIFYLIFDLVSFVFPVDTCIRANFGEKNFQKPKLFVLVRMITCTNTFFFTFMKLFISC